MISQRLEELSKDPDNPNTIAELVVTAIGAGGCYYICWKTRSGEYRQDSHGLPQALQEWLFPTDGTTRDFATLQVILGRGDEFLASDCNGKVENKNKSPEIAPPPPRLTRASTFRDEDLSASRKRLSLATYNRDRVEDAEARRRSYTLSSLSNGAREISPTTRNRRVSFMPIVVRPDQWQRVRPHSVGDKDRRLGDLQENEEYRQPFQAINKSSSSSPAPRPRSICECGVTHESKQSVSEPEKALPELAPAKQSATRPRPQSSYVNASIQTDDLPEDEDSDDDKRSGRSRSRHGRHSRGWSASSTASSGYTDRSSSSRSSRRSSYATDITRASTYSEHDGNSPAAANPIMMGKMQDYFRWSGYQLGDALGA